MQQPAHRVDDPTCELIALFGHREVAKSYSIMSYEAVRAGRAPRPVALDEALRGMLRGAPVLKGCPEGMDFTDLRPAFGYAQLVRPQLTAAVTFTFEAEMDQPAFEAAVGRVMRVMREWSEAGQQVFGQAPVGPQAQQALRRWFRDWAAKLPEKKALRAAEAAGHLALSIPTAIDLKATESAPLTISTEGNRRRVEAKLPAGMGVLPAAVLLRAVRAFALDAVIAVTREEKTEKKEGVTDAEAVEAAAARMTESLAMALYASGSKDVAEAARGALKVWEGTAATERLPMKAALRVLRWAVEDVR